MLIVVPLAAIGATGNAAAAEATVAARPDGDVRSEWRLAGSAAPTSASAALDDQITQPTSVTAADYLYAGSAGKVTEVRVADVPLGQQVATAARGWFYANTGTTTRLQVDLVWQGTVRASTILPVSSGFAWRSLTAPPPDQAAVNDVRLRFTALAGGDSNIRAAYVDLATRDCSTTAPSYGGYGPFGPSAWPAACWNPYTAASPFNRPLPPDVATRIRTDSPQIVGRVLGDISRSDRPADFIAHDDGTSGEPTYYSRPGDPTFFIRWGLCQRELVGDPGAVSILDRLARVGVDALTAPSRPLDLIDYVDRALHGMLPEVALQPDARLRRRWLASYVDEVVARDGALVDGSRDPVRRSAPDLVAGSAGGPHGWRARVAHRSARLPRRRPDPRRADQLALVVTSPAS